jgi:hypothetical protein
MGSASAVSGPERSEKMGGERGGMIRNGVRDEFIGKHEPLTAPASMPVFRVVWEMRKGPEER